MRRYSPRHYSPPRRGYGGRGRSPPRRGYGGRGRSPPRRGYGRRREQNQGSLLVRNIPLDCRPEELRVPFERFGVVRDVYIPKDYHTGEPRGFAFIQFVDPYEAAEAQYHMNGKIFAGREIAVVVALQTRKKPEEMLEKTRPRGPPGYGGHRSYYGPSRSRSVSRSFSPRYPPSSRSRYRSRSHSPAPKRQGDYSLSPSRRHMDHPRSSRGQPRVQDGDRKSYSPGYENAEQNQNRDGYRKRHMDHPRSPRGQPRDQDGDRRSYSPAYENAEQNQNDDGYRKRHMDHPRSPRGQPQDHDDDRRSYSPGYENAEQNQNDDGYGKKSVYKSEDVGGHWRSPGKRLQKPLF